MGVKWFSHNFRGYFIKNQLIYYIGVSLCCNHFRGHVIPSCLNAMATIWLKQTNGGRRGERGSRYVECVMTRNDNMCAIATHAATLRLSGHAPAHTWRRPKIPESDSLILTTLRIYQPCLHGWETLPCAAWECLESILTVTIRKCCRESFLGREGLVCVRL